MYVHALFDVMWDFKITIWNKIEFLPIEDATLTLRALIPRRSEWKAISVKLIDLKQQMRNANNNNMLKFLLVEDAPNTHYYHSLLVFK